jgi:TolB-like protein/Tfp pilus assembly protein PilF
VALKVLPPELSAEPERLARFQREARAVAALNHPNIVVLHSVEESGGTHFLTMELVEGRPLSDLIPPGGMPIERLLEHAIALADAVAVAHDRGITHRDLKPANVMVTPEGRVKVLDFGLAKLAEVATVDGGETQLRTVSLPDSLTAEGRIVGTVSYMAPEQAEGKSVDSRTDVFAFGVLLYQMATGRRPFAGDTSASTMAKILEARPEPPSVSRPDLPGDLDRIIGRCLEKRPADRYNDTRDLLADLRYLEQSGDSRSAAAPVARERRSRAPWLLAAALALAGVLLLLIRLWSGDGSGGGTAAPATEALIAPAKLSIAVLPLHNLSGGEESDYFSAGMTEEIISKLSRLEGLEVASRSSVAPFTDRARDVQQIARDLGVRYLLDGSVRRAGDRVRVSAQLVDAATGRNLWSDDFDGNLEDVFAMQEETALSIAGRLDLELSPEEQSALGKRLTENVAAYDAYLRGMALSRGWGEREKLAGAIAAFESALEHDPDFAAALAGLAFVECDMYRNFDSSEERLRRAEVLAERAVELDPTVPEASHALAMIAGNRYDYHRAAELLRETVRLAPKEARFWDNLSWALAYQVPPEPDASIEAAREALRLQPIFPGAYYHLGRALLARGDTEQAREAFEESLEQSPDFMTGHLGLAQYHLAVGAYDEALREMDRFGRKTPLQSFYIASIHAAAGDTDAALTALESSLETGFRDFAALDASPYLAAIRSDDRYRALLARFRG